ncbi:hypothetical protein CDAR_116631 [Caerostris darwini]|uniref:Uncharacterized protein n=1 Tax=Caerostris darwini TaxID=1538125 RepID=A0AAV4R2T1_9ARAC|nr:hypothetical protein CDAR_116631 [Caerostris darwini]
MMVTLSIIRKTNKWPLRQRNNNRTKTSGELNFRAIVSPGRSDTLQENGERHRPQGPWIIKDPEIHTRAPFGKLLSSRPHYLGRRFAEQRNNNRSETSGELNFRAIVFKGRSNTLQENGDWCVASQTPGPLDRKTSPNPCFFRKAIQFRAPLFGKEIRRMVMCVSTSLPLGEVGGWG